MVRRRPRPFFASRLRALTEANAAAIEELAVQKGCLEERLDNLEFRVQYLSVRVSVRDHSFSSV